MKKIVTIALFACIGAAVVSCGGSDSSTSSSTTGTFTATGMMSSARSMPTANLLENGQVLVAGGVGSASIAVGSADLYDPATRTFSVTGSMVNPRYAASSVRLLDGRIFVAGGEGVSGTGLNSV